MEREFQAIGILFTNEGSMRYNRSNKTGMADNKQSISDNGTIPFTDNNSWLSNIQTSFRSLFKAQKMAMKFGVAFLLNCMGWVSLGINTFLAATGGIDEVKQWVLLVFSCVFACVKVYQIYQNASHKREEVRSKKLENDSLEFDLNMKRFNHH